MARNVTIRDMDAGWGQALNGLFEMDGAGVDVGIFDEDGVHPNSDDGLLISEIAAIQEFGTDDIPARPFLATTYEQNRDRYSNQAESVFGGVLRGKLTVDQALQTLGAIQASDVKTTINNWTTPPNSPKTIASKGQNDPLVEDRHMRDAVKFKKVGR